MINLSWPTGQFEPPLGQLLSTESKDQPEEDGNGERKAESAPESLSVVLWVGNRVIFPRQQGLRLACFDLAWIGLRPPQNRFWHDGKVVAVVRCV